MIIKELADEFEEEFNFLGENTKKYKTFLVSLEKEVRRFGKNSIEIIKNKSYKLKLIDSTKFMVSSLLSFVDNLAEGIHKIICKYGHGNKKM